MKFVIMDDLPEDVAPKKATLKIMGCSCFSIYLFIIILLLKNNSSESSSSGDLKTMWKWRDSKDYD